jgi:uncharacterized membrane protein
MVYILLALVSYVVAVMTATAASRSINTNFAALVANAVSIIIPLLVVAQIWSKKLYEHGMTGIVMAILNGLAISIFVLLLNKSFQVNKVAIVTPVLYGVTIFLTAILSYIFFKEKITLVHLIGLLFVGVGIITITYAAVTGK